MHPHGHWSDPKIRRKFMDKLAERLNIKDPEDWSKISAKIIISNGGGGLVYKYGMSVYRTLCNVYPGFLTFSNILRIDTIWNPDWFKSFFRKYPVGHWEDLNNQRKFLESISSQYNISSPSQWHKVSIGFLQKKGGRVFAFVFDDL